MPKLFKLFFLRRLLRGYEARICSTFDRRLSTQIDCVRYLLESEEDKS